MVPLVAASARAGCLLLYLQVGRGRRPPFKMRWQFARRRALASGGIPKYLWWQHLTVFCAECRGCQAVVGQMEAPISNLRGRRMPSEA